MADASLAASGIYAIRNMVNGKVYVGSATNIKRRWAVHLHGLRKGCHHSIKLQRSWNLHGADAFQLQVLEYVPELSQLILTEQAWIDSLRAHADGYNTSPSAGSTLGKGHGADARRRMSESHKARLATPMAKAERIAQLKVTFSRPEIRAAQSAKAKAAWLNPYFRKAGKERSKRQTDSPEWKASQSAAMKAAWADPERKKAWSDAMKGRVSSKRQPLVLFGVRYVSITAAAQAHGRNRDWVKARMEPA